LEKALRLLFEEISTGLEWKEGWEGFGIQGSGLAKNNAGSLVLRSSGGRGQNITPPFCKYR